MVKNIGEKIREYRENSGISQKKLGLALGLSDKAVSAYESGRTLPPLETLHRISLELNKPLRFFLSDTEDTKVHERLDSIEQLLGQITKELQILKGEYKDKE